MAGFSRIVQKEYDNTTKLEMILDIISDVIDTIFEPENAKRGGFTHTLSWYMMFLA